MTSPKQITANRNNSKKATGPRTASGKRRSKLNALKHGASAESVCIPGEDPQAFDDRRQSLIDCYEPEGPEERFWVDRITELQWKSERIFKAEAAVIAYNYQPKEAQSYLGMSHADWVKRTVEAMRESKDMPNFSEELDIDSPATIAPKEQAESTETEWIKFGKVLANSAPTLLLLNRYQVSIERSLVKARTELESLQDRRRRLREEILSSGDEPSSNSVGTVIELTAKNID
jgi:hypothetical protein